jgi:hypothetical protein
MNHSLAPHEPPKTAATPAPAEGIKTLPTRPTHPQVEDGQDAKPLSEASRRLRGRPGRPQANGQRLTSQKTRDPGHVPDTSPSRTRMNRGLEPSALDRQSCVPRLLGIGQAAAYLGLSPWTVRDLVAAGRLHPVRIPLSQGREVRRLLIDRLELDALVDQGRVWRERHRPAADRRPPGAARPGPEST